MSHFPAFKLILFFFVLSCATKSHAQYCAASATSCDEHIEHVTVGSINNATGACNGTYNDYTAMSTNMSIGNGYTITVTGGATYALDQCGIWVDWNQDGDFYDANETVTVANSPGLGPYSAVITPPSGAIPGNTRMRIRIVYNGAPLPCGTPGWGEVEDYTVTVANPVPMTYGSTTVAQNNTAGAENCRTDREIIGIEIHVNGSTSPLDATAFRIRTDGSTSPAIVSNIDNIDVYYTGTSAVYSPVNLFGSAAPQPAGTDIDIVGNRTLAPGTNHFWVAYDINPNANLGDVLDAQCTGITVDGVNYNAPGDFSGAPSGQRAIVVCVPAPAGIVSGNTLWLRTDDAANLTLLAGNRVQEWTSPAAGGAVVEQLATAEQPIFHAPSPEFNFNPRIKFDGVDDDLAGAIGTELLGETGTVIIVSTREDGTALAFKGVNNYQVKPHLNCGFGDAWSSAQWQLAWNTGFPALATPDSRPRILGFKGGTGAFGFRNGSYYTLASAVGVGADVYGSLTLGSRGYSFGQNQEYCAAALSEVILYDRSLSTAELDHVQSYLALKYGLVLGSNGTALDYVSPTGTTIWNASVNAGFNYDVAGIGRQDSGDLDKRKSHSINGGAGDFSDILTVANGGNFTAPPPFANDATYFVWGRSNAPVEGNAGDLPANVESRFLRVWKGLETGAVGTVTLQFDMNDVPGPTGPGSNDLNEVRLLVDADGVFAAGATVLSPSYANNTTNTLRFEYDFSNATGYYFTIGSANYQTAPLPIELFGFTAECQGTTVDLHWTTLSEFNNDFFTVEKSRDGQNFTRATVVPSNGGGTTTLHYHWTDDSRDPGTIYYRLAQTDIDGKTVFYNVLAVDCSGESPFRIYPNPTADAVFLEDDRTAGSHLDIGIYNPVGELISRERISAPSSVDIPGAKGVYILKIGDGRTTHVHRVVKQ